MPDFVAVGFCEVPWPQRAANAKAKARWDASVKLPGCMRIALWGGFAFMSRNSRLVELSFGQ